MSGRQEEVDEHIRSCKILERFVCISRSKELFLSDQSQQFALFSLSIVLLSVILL